MNSYVTKSKLTQKGMKKMLSIVKSMSLHGLEGELLNIEVDISRWLTSLGNCPVCQTQA